jgi:hypothetical protein
MMKNKTSSPLLCMNPYQYNIGEINQLLIALDWGYRTFNLYGHTVLYVHGKFSFVDSRGIGNLELWYIDPSIDETVAQCVTFQEIDVSRCVVRYDLNNPGRVQALTILGDNDKIDLHIHFTQVDDRDKSFITRTVMKTAMPDMRLVSVDNHFGRSLSLINNMLPLVSITTNRNNDSVYKLVPKLKFNYNSLYADKVTFIIGFVELDADHNYSNFETAEKVFRDHGYYEVGTGEIDEKYLENIIVSPNDISIFANDEMVLEINYYNSKEDTERRITKDEVKASAKLFKQGDRAAKPNTSNDKHAGVVKITTLEVIAMVGAGPLTKKYREEAFVNVIDCELDKDMMLRINTSNINSAVTRWSDFDFRNIFKDSTSTIRFDFSNCALLETDKDNSGFRSTLLDFDEKKIYKVTYTK